MKIRRLAITLERGREEERTAHACGFVSRMIVRDEGVGPGSVSYKVYRMEEENGRIELTLSCSLPMLRTVYTVHGRGHSHVDGREALSNLGFRKFQFEYALRTFMLQRGGQT